jgi:hypothetical protein
MFIHSRRVLIQKFTPSYICFSPLHNRSYFAFTLAQTGTNAPFTGTKSGLWGALRVSLPCCQSSWGAMVFALLSNLVQSAHESVWVSVCPETLLLRALDISERSHWHCLEIPARWVLRNQGEHQLSRPTGSSRAVLEVQNVSCGVAHLFRQSEPVSILGPALNN